MEEEEEEEGGQLLAREANHPTHQPPPRPASVRERPRKAWEVGGGWTRSVSQLSGVVNSGVNCIRGWVCYVVD